MLQFSSKSYKMGCCYDLSTKKGIKTPWSIYSKTHGNTSVLHSNNNGNPKSSTTQVVEK